VSAVEEMDKNDEELRESIMKLWPIQGPTMHTILVPPNEGNSRLDDGSWPVVYGCSSN